MRNTLRLFIVLVLGTMGKISFGQQLPGNLAAILKNDDTSGLKAAVTKDRINDCYGGYSLLSEAVRDNAVNCFNLLIAEGADVNKSCNGYVPPLMHACKYGHLEMVKVLIGHDADKNYTYNGEDMSARRGARYRRNAFVLCGEIPPG